MDLRTKIGTATFQSTKEVGVFIRVGIDDARICEDYLKRMSEPTERARDLHWTMEDDMSLLQSS